MTKEKQLDWDKTFLKIAYEYAEHSTCSRHKVGAVITKNGRIISTGFNGTPAGMKHCSEEFKNIKWDGLSPDCALRMRHHDFAEKYEIHAEQNAIIFLTKSETNAEGGTCYTTLSPCSNCAKAIIQAGIKRVVYCEEYERDQSGLELLRIMNIETIKVEV